MNSPVQLVQIADDQNTDTKIVRLIGNGDEQLVPLFTYLMISDDEHGRFFLQVSSLNRNLSRFSPHPFDVIAMSQMLALIENRGYDKNALVSHVRFYEAQVLASVDVRGNPSTPFTRPSTGSIATFASQDEIIRSLQLPSEMSDDRRIGVLARSGNADVRVVITEDILNHHMLIAGSTGSGKSNLLANLAHIASEMGRCIILFDHKPDHQDHHTPNNNSPQPRSFRIANGQVDNGEEVVRYWTLDENDSNQSARLLSVPARELDPEVLAGTIFDKSGEFIQAEQFAAIITAYDAENPDGWTLRQIRNFVLTSTTAVIKSKLFANTEIDLNSQTVGAIKRKLQFGTNRAPSFIDRSPVMNAFGETKDVGSITEVLKPGLNVIRIGEDDARGYALFLSRLLRAASEARARLMQTQDVSSTTIEDRSPEMLILIDEAADIFKAESRYLRDAATSMLAERIRKGRSLRIGYVITVQDAGDVPENIRHNLNTIFVGRHRHQGTLRQALPTVREGLLAQADKLNPGEMLLDMFRVPSLLLVKLDVSRSKLTVVQ